MPLQWRLQPFPDTPDPFTLLDFTLQGQTLDPDDLDAIRWPVAARSEGGFVLSGRGPLWLYARLVSDAPPTAWLGIYDNRLEGGLVVYRPPGAIGPAPGQIVACCPLAPSGPTPISPGPRAQPLRDPTFQLDLHSDGAVRIFLPPAGSRGPYDHTSVGRLEQHLGLTSAWTDQGLILLDGPYPVWLAAAVLLHLRAAWPGVAVAINDPKLAGSVVVQADAGTYRIGQVLPDPPRRQPVPLLGLVGDPQSGKSVLSWKLYWTLQDRPGRVYRFDADLPAPTPEWATANLTGEALRRDIKAVHGDWSLDDIRVLMAQLSNLRRSRLDLVLLDLPGGQHRGVPAPIRIPPERQPLFKLIDAFIVLEKDAAAAEGWHRALNECGLIDRVIARVRSCPDASVAEVIPESALHAAGAALWTIHELDRHRIRTITPGVRALADWLHHRFLRA